MKKDGMHLYQHVQDNIMGMISRKELREGDRIPTEKELSEQMKVSRLTVRKAYAALTESGLVRAVQGKGTFVTELANISQTGPLTPEGTQSQNKRVIGVIFPEITTFFGPILKGIEELASDGGFTLNIMFNDSFEREEHALSTMMANGVDGIIINPRRSGRQFDTRNYRMLAQSGVPAVMVGKPPVGIDMDCVMCDDVTGSYKAVQRLVEAGHQKILRLFMSGDDAEALVERKIGFEEAMLRLVPGERYFQLDCSGSEWRDELLRVVRDNGITAVFSDSDSVAVQASVHLSGQGVDKPGAGDFITYNSADLCRQFHLNMTIVDIPREAMGQQALLMLKEKLSGDGRNTVCSQYSVFRPDYRVEGTGVRIDA